LSGRAKNLARYSGSISRQRFEDISRKNALSSRPSRDPGGITHSERAAWIPGFRRNDKAISGKIAEPLRSIHAPFEPFFPQNPHKNCAVLFLTHKNRSTCRGFLLALQRAQNQSPYIF
jgi:hypothetical protein